MEHSLDPLWQPLLQAGTQSASTLVLVVARLAGLFAWGPLLGHGSVPLKYRAWLVLALALVVTPALQPVSPDVPLDVARGAELAWAGLGELAVGLGLGLGLQITLAALPMAGRLIDPQIGTALAEVFQPELGAEVAPSGQLLHQLGLAVFVMIGGHLLLVASLLDSFHALPPGAAGLTQPAVDVLNQVLQQSMSLALRVAAPVLATMALLGMAMGALGKMIPHMDLLVVGLPVRALVGLFLLGSTAFVAGNLLTHAIPETLQQMHEALHGG